MKQNENFLQLNSSKDLSKIIESLYANPDFHVARLDFKFDIEALLKLHQEIIQKTPPSEKEGKADYIGYCLQSDDPDDTFYGGLHQTRKYNLETGEFERLRKFYFHQTINEIGKQFQPIFDKLSEIHLFQGRVLLLEKGGTIPLHTDGVERLTLHIPLQTNKDCVFTIKGMPYFLPADGAVYILNTRLPHHVENKGSQRAHLVFCLWPFSVVQPSKEHYEAYKDDFERSQQLLSPTKKSS